MKDIPAVRRLNPHRDFKEPLLMTRRTLLSMISAIGAVPAISAAQGKPGASYKVSFSDAEWKQRLSPAQYDVLRHEGTERPFTSALNNEKRKGSYHCAGCDLPLFASNTKYESSTGWPSFFDHLPGALRTKRDFHLILPRTEYHCARCGGHHGHVFNDGPKPTGLRYCSNGVALKFVLEVA
jgi:peptide-methionine (R)-S-oxide reductase